MDPVSLIVAALVAGASAALRDTASDAVHSAYASLKSLLGGRFGLLDGKVAALELAPHADTAALRTTLVEAGAGADRALIEAAAEVLRQADPVGSASGRYNVSISGGKGIVVGNEGSVTMNFEHSD